MASKASDIWNFFTKISSEVAKCRLCENQLACKQSCTKGLWGHFKAKHSKEYEKYLQKSDPSTKNQGISKFFGKEDPQKKADEQIARLMIRTNCSFLFVEAPELQNLFSLAYPKLQLHRRDYFRKNGPATIILSVSSQTWPLLSYVDCNSLISFCVNCCYRLSVIANRALLYYGKSNGRINIYVDTLVSGTIWDHDYFEAHAMKLIGWGQEKRGNGEIVKYWLGVNSWGTHWGEDGLFKLRRGTDESKIESEDVNFGTPFV
ncbi:hypothetical protein niasHT_033591 [Heterodera trifolii]|uniref:BED-type domain-containing protein n=1 Tax=Heterodera trifolii TaxID=157864 RepID=A0ABD2I0E1_9BILA